MYVLADTGPLFAAGDPSDQFHGRAQRELRRLRTARTVVLIARPTVLGGYILALRALGSRAALGWLEDVIGGTEQINPIDHDYNAGVGIVHAHPDQRITLFDGVLAALSRRLRIPVWTYDHHFDILRTEVWR